MYLRKGTAVRRVYFFELALPFNPQAQSNIKIRRHMYVPANRGRRPAAGWDSWI